METLITQIVSLGVLVSALAIIFSSIYDRPKRKEVQEMIDGKLEAVNQKIIHVAEDVKFIRSSIERKKK
ncbi:MAG: hypothetical protein H3C35_08535 [Bacteroidetes bacterium]|nr:hypothetical protein [Bacteroidota bacterium]